MPEMTAQEVANRLGIKLDTVYAYVSRGVLSTRRDTRSRRSFFDSTEVESVARRGRPRRTTRPAALDFVVETELTTIVDQRLRYRGREVIRMAQDWSFEQAAQWLWTGTESDEPNVWDGYAIHVPDLPNARDRIRAAVVISSAAEPLRSDLSTPAVANTARALIAAMVDAIPSGKEPIRSSVAARAWSRLSPRRPTRDMVAALNTALVLLVDHELAASTVAARVAASARADPFSVVLAGLGPISGPLHGGASTLVRQMLDDARTRGGEAALAVALERHGFLPGFGHQLYPGGDPRSKLLLHVLRRIARDAAPVSAADELISVAWRLRRIEPNIDLALAALTAVARMPADAGETIFTIARTAGWIAHAIEEYGEPPLRFRAHAVPRQR